MAFINGGASKTIIEMSKSFIHKLPKFKGGVNKFLAKNATFAYESRYELVGFRCKYIGVNGPEYVGPSGSF